MQVMLHNVDYYKKNLLVILKNKKNIKRMLRRENVQYIITYNF